MRDQAWLEQLLSTIWSEHFHDVARTTPIIIRFGKKARTRLGSITYEPKQAVAIIRLTSLFKDEMIPEMLVKATIVHELCHYAHGFGAAGERTYDFPHAGGVIRQEFAERGLEDLYVAQKRWLKSHWLGVVKKHYPKLKFRPPVRRRRRF